MGRMLLLALAATACGCTSDQVMRMDGVTPGAGDAIAANTVLQMVDPWQPGVEETRLRVPAQRAAAASSDGAGAADPTAATAVASD